MKQFEAEPQVVAGVKEVLDALRGREPVETKATTSQTTVSTSSTESDLYEEITPLPKQQDEIDSETREKLEECEKQLSQQTKSAESGAPDTKTLKAPLASLDDSFEEVSHRIYSLATAERVSGKYDFNKLSQIQLISSPIF